LSGKESKGVVYLVGAGPGDPALITVRGRALLDVADVVIYDYLSNPRLLSYCPQAETIYVGKKAASHSMTQADINALLVEKGRAGKRVVRLKGGDPFVFGRGGEECEALAQAGVKFEVVPGITAAIAGPAYAGIPVTHRDLNSSFTLITGHEKEEAYKENESRSREAAVGSSDLDWPSIAKLPCIAFYMGVKALPRICEKLIAHGMNPDTPAATIQWATTPKQRTVTGTVSNIVQRVTEAKIAAPAITIVGRVVEMRETINWFESRPLFGQTIVVTRTRQQASALSEKLEALGARVIEAPTIELTAPADFSEVDAAIRQAAHYDWIIFTSANGVRFTRARLDAMERDVRLFGTADIAAIGDATAEAIHKELALHVNLCPDDFVAEALVHALEGHGQIAGHKFLLLRADIARPILREQLKAKGALEVRDIAVYETKPAAKLPDELIAAVNAGEVNWVTFTSSSTVKNFVSLLGSDYATKLKDVKIASIGPITSQTLRDLGLSPTIEAQTYNVDGLVTSLAKS
jgi:uroporphyrinogen III methyltransferase/synthase